MATALGSDTPRGRLGKVGRLGMVMPLGRLGGLTPLGRELRSAGTVGNLGRVPGISAVRGGGGDVLRKRMERVSGGERGK